MILRRSVQNEERTRTEAVTSRLLFPDGIGTMSSGAYHKVEICGVNTARLKTLTPEEKSALLLRAHEGDKEARQALIDGNLRLVLSVVQRFAGRSGDLDDLFQVGCIGLIKSIDRFDVHSGLQLSTYAVPMINE